MSRPILVFLLATATITATHGVDMPNELSVERDLQSKDEICEDLEADIDNPITVDIKDSCGCSEDADFTTLSCKRDDACISSDGGDAMVGDYLDTYQMSKAGLSFTQTTKVEACFTYPDDMYDGETVCFSYTSDGLGTQSTCQVEVGDGNFCTVCRFCSLPSFEQISFDCGNLGYEDRSGCGSPTNNTDDSILQFLYKSELVGGCGSSGGSASARPSPFGSTFAPTRAPSTSPSAAGIINALLSVSFGVLPLLLMG